MILSRHCVTLPWYCFAIVSHWFGVVLILCHTDLMLFRYSVILTLVCIFIVSYWLVGWLLGSNGPFRSIQSISGRLPERGRKKSWQMREKMSKHPHPNLLQAQRPLSYKIQISRTPRHLTFTQLHRTTRPPPVSHWPDGVSILGHTELMFFWNCVALTWCCFDILSYWHDVLYYIVSQWHDVLYCVTLTWSCFGIMPHWHDVLWYCVTLTWCCCHIMSHCLDIVSILCYTGMISFLYCITMTWYCFDIVWQRHDIVSILWNSDMTLFCILAHWHDIVLLRCHTDMILFRYCVTLTLYCFCCFYVVRLMEI